MKQVETILLENIDNPSSFFIFPTDIAVSRWVDRLLMLRASTSERPSARPESASSVTVAMDKFIAWDKFKQNSIRAKKQNKQSIPSALRKMFASALIQKNAEICAKNEAASPNAQPAGNAAEPPIFSALIQTKWAQQANSFAGWITGILPHLAIWYRQTAKAPIDEILETADARASFSGEDRDLYNLARSYAQFLRERDLFEPAWETPPFEDDGKKCFIFFSESLMDFDEYRELLEASENVTIVQTDESEAQRQAHDIFFYANARSEITEAALYILTLRENKNVAWDSISVSVPETEAYAPYLFREFENRNIPYIRQTGKPLASYSAGQFFAGVSQCASSDFSFSSITALLLNSRLPWKDSREINDLIDFGIKNNCICSWTEESAEGQSKVNVWEDAFSHPFGGASPQTRFFFEDLKRHANLMRHAQSFAEVRKNYFRFRERFFDMENCLEETNLVLSRCVSELLHLVEIEAAYPDVRLRDPYTFFTEYLQETAYLAQQSASGVAILPYRTAAPAPFDCHIILGASQGNLQTVFAPLSFLSGSRREQLGIKEKDASLEFVKLHKFNSMLPAAFFCSEQTFSGYAIAHNALGAALKPALRFGDAHGASEKFAVDMYQSEQMFFASLHSAPKGKTPVREAPSATAIHETQALGFAAWKQRRQAAPRSAEAPIEDYHAGHPLPELIRARFCKDEKPLSVSPSSLGSYFECPLKWIFARVLQLEDLEIEAGLMAENIPGLVHHAILNLYLDELKKTGSAIAAPANLGTDKKPKPKLQESYRKLLGEKIEAVFENFPCLPGSDKAQMSMLTARLLRARKKLFHARLENFLAEFASFFAGCSVVASEARYFLEKDSHALNGIVDCILEGSSGNFPADGALVIVDFKTAKAANIPKNPIRFDESALSDFQIPAYLRLAEAALKKNAETALFFSIEDAKAQVWFGAMQNALSGAMDPKKEEDRVMRGSLAFEKIMGEFDEKTERFARKVQSGAFPASPAYTEKCPSCKHRKVCRVLYKIR